jgi:hypothetical protein
LAGGHVCADRCNDDTPDQAIVCEDVLRGFEIGDDGARHGSASRSKSETEFGPFEEFLEPPDLGPESFKGIDRREMVDIVR